MTYKLGVRLYFLLKAWSPDSNYLPNIATDTDPPDFKYTRPPAPTLQLLTLTNVSNKGNCYMWSQQCIASCARVKWTEIWFCPIFWGYSVYIMPKVALGLNQFPWQHSLPTRSELELLLLSNNPGCWDPIMVSVNSILTKCPGFYQKRKFSPPNLFFFHI